MAFQIGRDEETKRIIVDILMTALLLLLMAYHLTGQQVHEWIGAGMFALFIAHNLLNRRWYGVLFRGKYTAWRILQTAVNLLALLSMLCQLVSGMILSQYVFDFLPISGHTHLGRTLHLLGAYWGFALMSLHLGLHWNMVLRVAREAAGVVTPSKVRTLFARMAAALIALYGLITFCRYNLLSYMLLQNQFVSFDYEQSIPSFLIDNLAMMGLWICAAHYAGRLARLPVRSRERQQQGSAKKRCRT